MSTSFFDYHYSLPRSLKKVSLISNIDTECKLLRHRRNCRRVRVVLCNRIKNRNKKNTIIFSIYIFTHLFCTVHCCNFSRIISKLLWQNRSNAPVATVVDVAVVVAVAVVVVVTIGTNNKISANIYIKYVHDNFYAWPARATTSTQ